MIEGTDNDSVKDDCKFAMSLNCITLRRIFCVTIFITPLQSVYRITKKTNYTCVRTLFRTLT